MDTQAKTINKRKRPKYTLLSVIEWRSWTKKGAIETMDGEIDGRLKNSSDEGRDRMLLWFFLDRLFHISFVLSIGFRGFNLLF